MKMKGYKHMKTMKKLASLLLALVMALALAVPAFAAGEYSITVTNGKKSVSIIGNTYYAYKLFDATYDAENHVAYTVSKEFESFSYNGKSGDELIAAVANMDADALDAFAKAALEYATDSNNNIAAAGSTKATSETATISLNEPGYYLVTGTATAPEDQTVTAACALTTAKPTATVKVKVDAPSVDKKIVEGTAKVDANTASIGDSVNYEITSSVPDMKGYNGYIFVLEDTLSKGLTYNDDMTITVGTKTLAKDTDYTLTVVKDDTSKTTSLKIVFKNFIGYTTGDVVTVKYSATLNQDADLTQTGNPNEVKLIYSNNPNFDYSGDKVPGEGVPTGETPKSETNTYVTGIKLTKIDGKTKETLTGAKFEIKGEGEKVILINEKIYRVSETGTFYMLKDGSYTETAPTDATKDSYDSTTTKYEEVLEVVKNTVSTKVNATGYVNDKGVLTFEGLGEGTYTITEIIAPNGYNRLKTPITVVISAKEALDKCEWTVTVDGKTVMAVDNLFAFNVENNAGAQLPSTGGIGTTIFYVVGSVLVIGAAVVLITRKRMGKSDK